MPPKGKKEAAAKQAAAAAPAKAEAKKATPKKVVEAVAAPVAVVAAAPAKAAKKEKAAAVAVEAAVAPAKAAKKAGGSEGKTAAEQAAVLKEKAGRAFQNRNWGEARDLYTNAIELNPSDHTLFSNRSATFAEMNHFAKALEDANKVIAIKPEWARGYFRQGTAYEGLLLYPEAAKAYGAGRKVDAADTSLEAKHVEMEALLKELSFGPEQKESDNPDNDRFEDMCKWLRDGGGLFPKLYLRYYSEDYRGVHCLTRIPAEDTVLYVPLKYIMTSEIAKASDIGKKIIASGVDLRSKHSYLAAYLLQEKHKGAKSFWSPYMRILPQKYANMPCYFDEELLSWLKGSMTMQKIADRIDSLRREYDNIRRGVPEFQKFTLDEFIWARLVVITRIFGLVVEGNKTDGLVPYADMLNHKKPSEKGRAADECETKWTFEDSRNGFIITTVKSIGRGDQIFDSYGRKCNSRFFVNYGFTLLDNVEDNEATIRVVLPANDPHYHMKIRYLGGRDHSSRREFQIPAGYTQKKVKELFSFMRFVHARDSEVLSVSSGEDMKLAEIEPLSVANELKVLADLKQACETALAAFPETIETDEKLLATEYTEWGNKRNCIIMRRGEKQVLHWFLDLVKLAVPLLKTPWKDLKRIAAKHTAHTGPHDTYVTMVVVPLAKKA